MDLKRCAVYR